MIARAKRECWFVCIFQILCVLAPLHSLLAEHLPFSFRNNKIRVVADRSTSSGKSAIILKIKATESTGYKVFKAHHPSRLVIDTRNSRTTRNKQFTFHDSDVMRSIRCGVHPGFLRVVVDFKTDKVPPYFILKEGYWLTVTITESGAPKREFSDLQMAKTDRETPEKSVFEDLSLRVFGWNKLGQDTKKDSNSEQTLTNHLEVRPEIEYDPDAPFKAVVSAEANIFSEFEQDSEDDSEIRLFDAYINHNSDWYNIRLGNQIVSWGKSDEVSPLDIVNPEDLRDGFVRNRSERKIPIPMANVELMDESQRLQLLYMPVFRNSRLDLSGSEWALFGSNDYQDSFLVDDPDGDEFGARYLLTFDTFDIGFSYLSTYNDLPAFAGNPLPTEAPRIPKNLDRGSLIALAHQQGQTLEMVHPRQEVFGFEYETVYESIGIRGDVAYKKNENFVTNGLERYDSDTFQWTTGFDWLSSNDLYLNIQYSQTYVRDYNDSLLYTEELQHGIYSDIYKELWYNKLRLGIKMLYGFPLEQQYYNPYFGINYWDNLTFELGGDFVSGESISPLGFYNTNDQIYLITSLYF